MIFNLTMFDNTNYSDNIYHADYLGCSHQRKKMNKHKKHFQVKKIIQFKTKNNLGPETWISSWDVYKAVANKKRKHAQAKSIRARGYDYKFFSQCNEIPYNNYGQGFWDTNWYWEEDYWNYYSHYLDYEMWYEHNKKKDWSVYDIFDYKYNW